MTPPISGKNIRTLERVDLILKQEKYSVPSECSADSGVSFIFLCRTKENVIITIVEVVNDKLIKQKVHLAVNN